MQITQQILFNGLHGIVQWLHTLSPSINISTEHASDDISKMRNVVDVGQRALRYGMVWYGIVKPIVTNYFIIMYVDTDTHSNHDVATSVSDWKDRMYRRLGQRAIVCWGMYVWMSVCMYAYLAHIRSRPS